MRANRSRDTKPGLAVRWAVDRLVGSSPIGRLGLLCVGGDMSPGPAPLNASVSAQMQRMPRERTNPEMLLRRELHRRGMRFRVNYRELPGRPDIAFTRVRLAVFVDGCFWHMCPLHSTMPKNNAEWWQKKLLRNVERDGEKDASLIQLGWRVLHVWEHENPVEVAGRVSALWSSLRSGIPSTPVHTST